MSNCECADRGLPEGLLCGKPDCPRTVAAKKSLKTMLRALSEASGYKMDPESAKTRENPNK